MALKAVLDSLDNVPDSLKTEYKKGEDGKFYLDIDELDSHTGVGALKRAKEHEKQARKDADTALGALQAQFNTLKGERDTLEEKVNGYARGTLPKADVDTLEQSWKDKLTRRETELTATIDGLTSQVNTMLVDNVAQSLAADLSDFPEVLLPHVSKRLATDTVDGKLVTRVLDAEGKKSALTVAELRAEMLQDKRFAGILKGSHASGSGANGGSGGGGATKKLSDYTESERRELATKQPAVFAKLVEDARTGK